MLLKAEGEDGIFEGAGAVESPLVLGDGLGEIGLDGAGRSEGFADGVALHLEGCPVFGCVNDDLAGKAVAKGVQRKSVSCLSRTTARTACALCLPRS